MNVADGWRSVLDRTANACAKSGRSTDSVKIVAVSKGVAVERMMEAYSAGARRFGENYVQEALPKIDALEQRIGRMAEWHFIGALQSNKAKKTVGPFSLIHSVDRVSVVEELERARKNKGTPVNLLIEVNVASEASKSGVAPAQLRQLTEFISTRTELNVLGLMSFPALAGDPEKSRLHFTRTRELSDEVRGWGLPRVQMTELSMGITSDFDVAIEEGATLIRVGTAIFGRRLA